MRALVGFWASAQTSLRSEEQIGDPDYKIRKRSACNLWWCLNDTTYVGLFVVQQAAKGI